MDRTIIRNAIVISMDPAIGEHLNADVLIEGPKIAAVAPNLGAVDAREIDGHDMIVLPGFVDTHRHTWQCLFAQRCRRLEPRPVFWWRPWRHGRAL
jgi:5-methylthioadenosine/S-adenosylhomocysteine deaminase